MNSDKRLVDLMYEAEKLEFTKTVIRIAFAGGDEHDLEGLKYKHMFIEKSKDPNHPARPYQVTHIPTGRICGKYSTLEESKLCVVRLADIISPVMTWEEIQAMPVTWLRIVARIKKNARADVSLLMKTIRASTATTPPARRVPPPAKRRSPPPQPPKRRQVPA